MLIKFVSYFITYIGWLSSIKQVNIFILYIELIYTKFIKPTYSLNYNRSTFQIYGFNWIKCTC